MLQKEECVFFYNVHIFDLAVVEQNLHLQDNKKNRPSY